MEQGSQNDSQHAGRAELEDRLAALEERVAALETRADGAPADPSSVDASPGTEAPTFAARTEETFWALQGVKERSGPSGGVLFTGAVSLRGRSAEYQWARSTEDVLDRDWSEHADAIAALGHPLRMSMLRLLLDGERTVAQLVDELQLGSTGVAYHHLHQLGAAGWVDSPRRGEWRIATSRIVALMTIVIATEKP